jgi:type I restriction enzyme, S subunit
MEVKPGYKQTEVGVIPEDWDYRSLRDIVDFTNGQPHEQDVTPSGHYFLVTLDSIDINGSLKKKHKETDVWDDSLKKNDLVAVLSDLAHGNLLGLCDLIPEDGKYVLNQRMGRLRRKIDADPLFLKLQINGSQSHFKARGQGTSQRHVYKRDFDALVIPFPLPCEQRTIAAALSDVDGLLEGLDQLIAKKRDLKQAAMQQLLTGQTRLPGYHGEWEETTLRELGQFLKGSGVRKDQTRSGNLACVRYGELYTRHNYVIHDFNSWISPEVASSAVRLRKGDILFAGSGETKEEIGKCAAFISDIEAYAGGDIVILRPHDADAVFLGYFLNTESINRQKASRGQGDAVVHISSSSLGAIRCRIPKPPEQIAIAEVLTEMDMELAALEQRRDKTRAVKQGMMQQLLTGRIRLVKPEQAEANA